MITMRGIVSALFFLLVLLLGVGYSVTAEAANLSLQPSAGTFVVGSTFNVQILLDTQDEAVNALDVELLYPPNLLQVVSPTVGTSIIGVWTTSPRFDNTNGILRLQGGIPEGITASRGLVSTVTFRVKGSGRAALRFGNDSRVLLHDGRGTDVLESAQSGVYTFTLPPPAGPDVSSDTHRDQTRWYSNSTASLYWITNTPARGYSYTLNQVPISTPENEITSEKDNVAYRNLSSGTHYFHIKAMNPEGTWGGVTHFAINVDVDPPADFPIEIRPGKKTTSSDIAFSFATTDAHSGIDHYEYKIVPLGKGGDGSELFVEVASPVLLFKERGTYDIIVRAYDSAGNFREESERVKIMSPLLYYGTDLTVVALLILLVGLASFAARKLYMRHLEMNLQRTAKTLPEDVRGKLKELKKYKSKYGTLVMLFALFISYALFAPASPVYAQTAELSPPVITTVPKSISNDEIFYLGGRTESSGVDVVIYMQNLRTGETFSYSEISGENGEWFYRHPSFLSSGEYLVWTQAKTGQLSSPPSPQIRLSVTQTAIQLGSSRISYETLYLLISILLLLILIGLSWFIVVYGRKVVRMRQAIIKEIREAEEAVREGFKELRRDIEVELGMIKKIKMSKELSREEKEKEEHLLKDLAEIEKHIAKEVYDIEKLTF